MYKILISGYYGFNNIGDESILRTVIDNLREKLPDQVDLAFVQGGQPVYYLIISVE